MSLHESPTCDPPASDTPSGLTPAALGVLCCVVSVIGYSMSNICLRKLAGLHAEPAWVACVKESFAVAIVGPLVLVELLRGRRVLPTGRPLVLLVLVGLATQVGGNASVQWAMGKCGLAVVIPSIFAAMLTASALLSWLLLGERASRQALAAIGLLLVALALLGYGKCIAGPSTGLMCDAEVSRAVLALGIGASIQAGIIYSLLSITIRHCVTGTTRRTAVVLIITGMGVVSLGPLSAYRIGIEGMIATPPEQLFWMLVAGVCNLVAFIALTRGLQLVPVVYSNILNATQLAIAVVAGIALFREEPNPWLVAGVSLTLVGIFLVGRPQGPVSVDQHV